MARHYRICQFLVVAFIFIGSLESVNNGSTAVPLKKINTCTKMISDLCEGSLVVC